MGWKWQGLVQDCTNWCYILWWTNDVAKLWCALFFSILLSLTRVSGKTSVSVVIPKSVPSGEYILRVEHIALHVSGPLFMIRMHKLMAVLVRLICWRGPVLHLLRSDQGYQWWKRHAWSSRIVPRRIFSDRTGYSDQ